MKKPPTFTLSRDEAVTTAFAFRNYIDQLRQEIKTPTRAHGPAESAMALTDADPLAKRLEQWLKETPR